MLFLFDSLDLTSAVESTVEAHLVRRLRLMTLGALPDRDRCKSVVGAALRGPLFRMAAFWIRHESVLLEQCTEHL